MSDAPPCALPETYSPPADPPVRVPLLLEDWVTVLSMATLACITLANVIVRYLTNESFAWTEEISIFLLVVLTMSASGSAFVRKLHIRIEMLADGGSTERQRRFTLVSTAVTLLFFLVLTVLLGRMAFDDFNWGDTSPAIGVPVWWYSMWLPVLSITISLRLLGMLIRAWRH
ncbi:MAG TPA: TRAP transporter small permease [Castellaniella sp.]|uniref:TRAP transporter small permease n=1 Tax=Castellaniella sp. TaxID=1955812 RepID=UPI002F24F403